MKTEKLGPCYRNYVDIFDPGIWKTDAHIHTHI